MFTRFMDMHSGGRTKLPPYEYIYIEAPEKEARIIFQNRFDRDPDHVTCQCCGNDYSVSESNSLASASAYDRGCKWDKSTNDYDPNSGKIDLDEYAKREDVLIILALQINPNERVGSSDEYEWD